MTETMNCISTPEELHSTILCMVTIDQLKGKRMNQLMSRGSFSN